jgi:hypothetical protein
MGRMCRSVTITTYASMADHSVVFEGYEDGSIILRDKLIQTAGSQFVAFSLSPFEADILAAFKASLDEHTQMLRKTDAEWQEDRAAHS